VTAATTGVVFVNYRSGDLIRTRAAALAAAGYAVVVADNSGELAAEGVAGLAGIAGVDCFDTGANVGFGAGCNRAVERLPSGIDVVCLHNPDVDAPPPVLAGLAAAVRGHGAAAPALRIDGVMRRRGYHYPSVPREAYVARRAVSRSSAGARPSNVAAPAAPAATATVRERGRRFGSGALLAVERDAFESVGGFDENYFLYCEDLDLWHRIGRAGHPPVFVSDLVADHAGASGSSMGAATRELLRWVGLELFVRRFARTGWRPYRAVHRALLGSLDATPELQRAVGDAWARGAHPDEVAHAIRARLERRTESMPSAG
jgi:GT2 family glycosyltransferase